MANKIGIVIAADGEQQFSVSMRNCSQSAKNLQNDLKTLKNDFKENANSIEYLTQRQNMLKAAQDAYKRALDSAKSGLSHQKSVYKDQQKNLEELKKKLSDAEKSVKSFEKAGDTSSKGYKAATKSVEDYKNAIEKQSVEIQKSEGKLNQWEHTVNSAQHDLNAANNAIDQNSKYLREAANSADGCATSIDKYGREVKEAGDEAKESSSKIKQMGEAIKTGLLNRIGGLAAESLKNLGAKAAEAAKYVIDVGSTFEASMSKVEALSGATGSELEALKDKASELGRTTMFSASEAADALSNMALAGWSTQEMLSGIDGVLQLAAAGGMDLATAADSVAGYLSAFNMKASESSKLADVMATAQAKSKTTTDQLSQAYSTCATNLTQAGQAMTTTTALLEGMASVNDTGSAAGTKLSAVMSQITQKMKDGKIQIGDTKVAVTDSTGAFRDMVDIIEDVEKATDGMTNAERAAALQKTFNRQSTAGMNELLSVGSEKLREYKKELDNSEGAAKNMAETMQNNLQGKVKELNSATEGLGNALYDKVSGPLTSAVQIATGLINGITDAINPQKTALEQFIADIETENERITALVDAAEKDKAQAEGKVFELQAYKDTILDLQEILNHGGKLDAFQLYQMKTAVSAVAQEVPAIGKNFDETTGKINLTTKEIETMFKTAEQGVMDMAIQNALQQELQAVADAKINEAKALAAVREAQKEYDEYVKSNPGVGQMNAAGQRQMTAEFLQLENQLNSAKAALKSCSDTTENTQKSYENFQDAAKDLAREHKELEESMGDSATSAEALRQEQLRVRNANKEAAESAKEASEANGELSESEDEAAKTAEEAAQKIKEAHGSAAESIKQAYTAAKQSIEDTFKVDPSAEGFGGGFDKSVEEMTRSLEKQLEGMQNYQKNLEIVKEHVGKEIAPEFMQYLINMGEDGANTLQHIVDTFNGKVEDSSKSGEQVVKELSDAYVQGLNMQDGISTELAQDAIALQTGLKQLGSTKVDWSNLESAVQTALESLGGNVDSSLQSAFMTAARTARTCGVAIPEGLIEGIQEADDPEAAIQSAIDQLNAAVQGQLDGLIEVAKASGAKIPDGIEDGISKGGDAAIEAYKKLLESLSETDINLEEIGKSTGETLASSQAEGVESKAGEISNAAKDAATDAAESAEDQKSEFEKAGESGGSELASGISSQASAAAAAGSELAQAALAGARQWEGSWYSVGVNMALGVSNGIQSQAASIAAQASAMVSNALNAAKATAGVASPAKKWRDLLGKQLGKGTALGIKQSTHETVSAAEYQLGRTLAAAQKWLEKNKKKISKLGESISSATEYTWLRLGDYEASRNFGVGKTKTTGSGKNKKTVKKDAETYYNEILNAAKDYMEKVKVLYSVTDQQELSYWNKVVKRLKKGTSTWYDARSKIKELRADIEKEKYDSIVSNAESYVEEQQKANAMSISNEITYWNKIIKQLKYGSDQYKTVAEKIANLKKKIGTMNSAESILGSYRTYFDMSEKAIMEYWDEVRKHYDAGTEDRIAADQKYLDAKEAYNNKLKEIEDSYIQKIEEANQKYKDALEERKKDILNSFDIFDAFESRSPLGEELLFNIQAQAAGYEEWSASIEELQKRGIFSDKLMEELTNKGPQQIASIKALLMLTDDQLKKYQIAYDRREAAALAQAEKDTASIKKTVEEEIKDLKKQEAEEIEKASKSASGSLITLASQIRLIAEDMTSALVAAFRESGSKAPESTGSSVSSSVTSSAGLTSSGGIIKPAPVTSTPATSQKTTTAASTTSTQQSTKKDIASQLKEIIKKGDSHKKSVSDKEKKSHSELWQYIVKKYGRAIHNKHVVQMAKLLGISVDSDPTSAQRTKVLNAIKKKGLARGTRNLIRDGINWIDEDGLGSELIVRKSDNAVLTRLKAHDAVIPANFTDNLFKWGAINPESFSVATGAEMNSRMFSAQMRELEKANSDILDSLSTIINYLPMIAAGLTIDGKKMSVALGDDMSQTLAAQYRRRR